MITTLPSDTTKRPSFYSIVPIDENAPELPEQLGTKTKYWLHENDKRYLFKIGRLNTGENWAEKVACELCTLLGLPHAHYELALWKQHKGVICETVVPNDGRLVMGNELLSKVYTTYPSDQVRNVSDHAFDRVYSLLSNRTILLPIDWSAPEKEIEDAFDVFTGYLMLDAWIANQDRHHENWGVINYDHIYLAPTFDHAASMGQNESDENRKTRLTTRDQGWRIDQYVQRARSAIYLSKGDKKPLFTVQAFVEASKKRPKAAKIWLGKLRNVSTEQCLRIFERIPDSEISEIAIEFALTLLELNKQRLLQTMP